jgi:hypothetical protein
VDWRLALLRIRHARKVVPLRERPGLLTLCLPVLLLGQSAQAAPIAIVGKIAREQVIQAVVRHLRPTRHGGRLALIGQLGILLL